MLRRQSLSADPVKSLILAPEGKPAPMYSRSDSPRLTTTSKQFSSLTITSAVVSETSRSNAGSSGDQQQTKHEQVSSKKKDVVIHVYDENRNAKRDFYCKQYLLLREMKFFAYLADKTTSSNQIDIDVHCDIEVFEWLMMFITRQRPALEPRSVVSILISSNFLQMATLQDICLEYIRDHINEIIKIPIDMNCIGKPLLSRLSKLLPIPELDTIVDPKDKLSSKLHMHKLSELLLKPITSSKRCAEIPQTPKIHYVSPPVMVVNSKPDVEANKQVGGGEVEEEEEEEQPIIFRKCKNCHTVYPKHEESNLACDEGVLTVNCRGNIFSYHEREESFNFNEWVSDLFGEGIGWKGVFWRVWGLVYHTTCVACKRRFALADYAKCRRHVESVVYSQGYGVSESSSDSQKGKHLCCGEAMYRFNPFQATRGCSLIPHVFEENFKTSLIHQLFEIHSNEIVPLMSHCLNLELKNNQPETIQYINVQIYTSPSVVNQCIKPVTYPIGFNNQQPTTNDSRTPQVVPRNLSIYMQREEDMLRMQAMILQSSKFRQKVASDE
ncbi:hypothetical protein BDR26DRAFT_934730 [Obelidium mucronatum]|nr:hypothetical protein BDR26DRAFT_934730 [Obelidium mucronatum]